MRQKFREYAKVYQKMLLDDVIPFWENHSIDKKHGGYFTCLTREGDVFDSDKFIWLQARQMWMFSILYNRIEKKEEWLTIAQNGMEFLKKNGRDNAGNWYFSLNQKGEPLIQPYNIFSDCFAAMAFSQYAIATGDKEAREIARFTYRNILKRKDNPKGKYNKTVPDTRPMKNFALPMILCNLSLELEDIIPAEEVEKTIDDCVFEVMEQFFDQEKGTIFENRGQNGEFVDCFDGRLIIPGHGIEAMWFIMDIANRRDDKELMKKAVEITLSMLEFGWDETHKGIFYFLDKDGHPPQQLEWDQKLWWVHLETLVALSKAYMFTKNEKALEWYEEVQDYTLRRFPDPPYGEWWGYLNRHGEVSLSLKGGKWKGCFHVPRALYQCWQTFEKLSKES